MDKEKMLKVFDDYLKGYNKSNLEVSNKIEHSKKVMELSGEIARSLGNMNDEEVFIAELIGLFHDLGRFEQLRVYNTKVSDDNLEHAGLSVNVLFDMGLIRKVIKNANYDEIIKTVIYYHNKFEVPDYLDAKSKIFVSILRDADKVDDYKKLLIDKSLVRRISHYPTKEVYEVFSKFKPVDKNKAVNDTDKLIVILGLIFDINYKYTLSIIKDEKIVDRIIDYLYIEEDEIKKFINDIRVVMNSYINKRIGG